MNIWSNCSMSLCFVLLASFFDVFNADIGAAQHVDASPSSSSQHQQQRETGKDTFGECNNLPDSGGVPICKDTTKDETSIGLDGFYAWPIKSTYSSSNQHQVKFIQLLFPNQTQFQMAWERYPLLSKVSFSPKHKQQQMQKHISGAKNSNVISTMFHNRSLIEPWLSSQMERLKQTAEGIAPADPILSLFQVDDTPILLSQTPKTDPNQHLTHGKDYKLVKKVLHPQTQEEYMGMLPSSYYPLDKILQHFHYGGFSLVVDKMHRRWKQVAKLARVLEEELESVSVGVNLYLTPEVVLEDVAQGGGARREGKGESKVRQGFEAHWDWMDVIVIQLSGRKQWSISKEPTIYLSNKDQKRKPTMDEVQYYAHHGSYDEFTLCPGDVLYIPRGHVHNASTVLFDELNPNGALHACPSYPNNNPFAQSLANRLDGPSLHLTFGLEQGCEGTVESLLHHALHAYFDDKRNDITVISEGVSMEAIPPKICSNPDQTAGEYGITWKSVLHHSLADVARREHECDNPSYRGLDHSRAAEESNACAGTSVLRKSVPLLLLHDNNLKKSPTEEGDDRLHSLKQTYLHALDTFLSASSIPQTVQFIRTHLLQPPSDGDLTFCYPNYNHANVILCPDELLKLPQPKYEEYTQIMNDFVEFAKINFDEALVAMNRHGKKLRERSRERQDAELDVVGQDYG